MSFFTRHRVFQKSAVAIVLSYAIVMVIVVIIAYNRTSGVTRIDTTQLMKIRNPVVEKP